jgi:hypothetical protein
VSTPRTMKFTTLSPNLASLEVTAPMSDDDTADGLTHRLVQLLADAMAQGYTIEVGQRIHPLAPSDAVTVASIRRARGFY